MNFARLAIAVTLTNCAAPIRLSPPNDAVLSAPASDFVEIAHDRCSPVLDGLYVSHEGAIDLVRGMRKLERDYQVKAINKETELKICNTKFEASQQELMQQSANKAWALIGKLSVAGIASAVVVTGIVLVAKAIGASK